MLRNFLLFCLGIPALLCLNTACGLATYPLDNTIALVQNNQTIKFTVPIVDESDAPLDDVQVKIVRQTQAADVYWHGVYTEPKKQEPITISRRLYYESTGAICAKITFSKPGYESVTNYYSNSDDFSPDGRLQSVKFHYKCINVSKGAPPAVVLRRQDVAFAD
jgi:hypothetical protein